MVSLYILSNSVIFDIPCLMVFKLQCNGHNSSLLMIQTMFDGIQNTNNNIRMRGYLSFKSVNQVFFHYIDFVLGSHALGVFTCNWMVFFTTRLV